MKFTGILALLACAAAIVPGAAMADTTWSTVGRLNEYRYGAAAAALPDGGALIAGGDSPSGSGTLASAERFSVTRRTWSPVAPMKGSRSFAATASLSDGRVLVAGGRGTALQYLSTAELFDPVGGSWTSTGPMRAARSDAVATRLNDGRVLVIGGYGPTRATGAEIYDPVTGAWSATGAMHAVRATPAVARLQDGRVLVAGGWEGSSSYLASAEIYDPGTDTWTETAPLGEARLGPSAVTLPDGRVLVAGGYGYVLSPKVYPFASRTAELYDPASATWTRTGDLLTPRGEGSVMVNLNGGRPVMVGGFWWTNVDSVAATWSTDSYERTIETYDAKAGSWTSGPRLAHGRAGHVAVVLDHNAILVAGGYGSGMDAELLADPTPTPTPAPTTTPTATPSPSATAVPIATVSPTPTPTATATPASTHAKLLPMPKRVTLTRAGTLSIGVTCDGIGPCRDTLILRAGKSTLAKATFTLRRRATIKLKLSKTAVRNVARTGTKVTLELKDARVVVRGTLKRH